MINILHNFLLKKIKILLSVFILSCFIQTASFGQVINNSDLLTFNRLIKTISNEHKTNPDTLTSLIKEAKSIIDKYDADNCWEQSVELRFWEAINYIHKKEPKTTIEILENIYQIALEKKHLRLGSICQHLATQKHKQDNSFDGNAIFEEVLQQIDTNEKTDFLLRIYNGNGLYYYKNKEYDKALKAFRKTITFQDKVISDRIFYDVFQYLGIIYFSKSELKESLDAMELATTYAEKIPNKKLINIGKSNQALIKSKLGLFDEAITTYFELLNQCTEENDQYCIAGSHLSIALAYEGLEFFDRAIEHAEKAIKLTENNEDVRFKKINQNASLNLALYCSHLKQYEKSLNICRKLIAGKIPHLGKTHVLMAANYSKLKNIKKAKYHYKLAISILETENHEFDTYDTYITYGNFLLKTGEIQKGGKYCKEAYSVFEKLNHLEAKVKCLNCLSSYYEKAGDHKNYMTHYKDYIFLRDSLINKKSIEKITTEKLKYEHEKEQLATKHQIERLTLLSEAKDAKLQRRRTIIVSGIALLLLTFFFFYYRQRKSKAYTTLVRKRNQDLKESNTNLSLKNEEIERLLALNERTLFSKDLKISTLTDAANKIEKDISNLIEGSPIINNFDLTGIKRSVGSLVNKSEVWEDFKVQFEKIRPNFFAGLKAEFSSLTVNDLKHCSYIVSKLKSKEVASLLSVSPRSVETTRYRIKKKLNLDGESDLYDFLTSLSKNLAEIE